MGVEWPLTGSSAFQSSFPVSTSKARIYESNVPAMKTSPPPVTMGPPRLGDPGGTCGWPGAKACMEPSGTCQRILPRAMSTAVSMPPGGGGHDRGEGQEGGKGARYKPEGAPARGAD